MSQYGSMPAPGPYIPPNQGAPAQQQAAQQPTPYQSNATSPGTTSYAQKTGGGFGQMMNQRLEQAVTTGKPMLNKLGKSISSKLGNKPMSGPPQHLQSYQNYQGHGQQNQSQAYQQPTSQALSPQPQQQQWGQAQQQSSLTTSPYPSAHHSPYQQSSYATPTSGPSGQPNYFPQQTPPAPISQAYAPHTPVTTSPQYGQVQALTHGQLGYGQIGQGLYQPVLQQESHSQGSYVGQQTGIVASSQDKPGIPNHGANTSPSSSAQSAQWQWGSPSPVKQDSMGHHQHQHWNSTSPPSQYSQSQVQMPTLPASPSPTQHMNNAAHVPTNGNAQSSNSLTPVSQQGGGHPGPTEFIAELPADLGSLSLAEAKAEEHDPSVQSSQYQAPRPSVSQSGSPSSSFVIPRRSISTSTLPLTDPWRFADPATETPTREFYILADLLYDALDRKFEPRNTGLLEAPKIIGSWVKLTEDARRLFSYRAYSAFAKLWSLEDIPHLMVPCQPALTPIWNFNQLSHAQDVRVTDRVPTPTSTYATYMPALNRAGWYKFFFLEVMQAPEDIGDLIPTLCADTYKPGVLNHPDLNKRDKSEVPALQNRAAEIQTYAIARVCEETKTAMAVDPDVPLSHTHTAAPVAESSQSGGTMTPEDMAVRMHRIQAERQVVDMAAWTMLGVSPRGHMGGGYGSLV